MDIWVAESILREAKASGVYKKEMPEDDAAKAVDASELVVQAKAAFDKGMRGDAVITVLRLAGFETEPIAAAPLEPREGYEPSDHARESLGRLPVPRDIEGDPPEIPRDMSELPDREIRRLHASYAAYIARVTWLIGVEKADLAAAKITRDRKYAEVFMGIDKVDAATGKPKLSETLQHEANAQPDVRLWNDRVLEHESRLNLLNQLYEVYKSIVDRSSRDWTMRQEEFLRAGGGR